VRPARKHDRPTNRLLASLPDDVCQSLSRHFEDVSLTLKQRLFEADHPIDAVYFPQRGAIISLVTPMQDGSVVEVATVGHEGMVGVGVYLEAVHVHYRAFCQMPGRATRIEAGVFRREMEASAPLRTLMHRYTQALIIQLTQGSACNTLHALEERCARWLLTTGDRAGTDEFPLTQEFLSQMLGVRRASVTVVAGMLQQAGLIRYSRGRMTLVDRRRLEEASCECYGVIKREVDRLIGGTGT
jgi:CRP-like cAMP-binding protein